MQATTSIELTQEGLNTIKKAKSVVFHYYQGQSYLNCIMDGDNRHKDVRIECGLEVNGGFYPGKYNLGEVIGASHAVMHPHWDEEWQTIVSTLKVGDELTIRWRACNNNDYLTKAGLYKDEVFLIARRTVRGKPKKLSFFVATCICENNTAKMIKHTSTPKSVIGDY